MRGRPLVFFSTVWVVGLLTSTSDRTLDSPSLLSSSLIVVLSSPLGSLCFSFSDASAAAEFSGEDSGVVAATDRRVIWRVDIRGGVETGLVWLSNIAISSATSDASCPEATPICSDLRGRPMIPPREPRDRLTCPRCAIDSLLRLFLRSTPGGSLSKLEGTASASAARIENGMRSALGQLLRPLMEGIARRRISN